MARTIRIDMGDLRDIITEAVDSALDSRYLAAVSRGDTVLAQRMVTDAACRAGYGQDSEWRLMHSAPDSRYGAPISNPEGIYPDDLYGPHGAEYYGTGNRSMDEKSVRILRKVRGRPGAMVTVYRAVPGNVRETSLRNGDWVTINREYAIDHGETHIGDYRIISDKVPAGHVFTDGNSIHEQGYDDGRDYTYQDTVNGRKLLDPVTYDDNGNVIPLSRRFDTHNPDPRY